MMIVWVIVLAAYVDNSVGKAGCNLWIVFCMHIQYKE